MSSSTETHNSPPAAPRQVRMVGSSPRSPTASMPFNEERAALSYPSSPAVGRPPPLPHSPTSTTMRRRRSEGSSRSPRLPASPSGRRFVHDPISRAQARDAQRVNDSMVYLDGPQIYACAHCRTHLTSHDDIISKSFHGRHGRAYLFDQCVNVTIGPAEDRLLMTGLHSVSDIFCRRCNTLIGWTYKRAYEASQKYKEGKFIIEKINLYLEESGGYDVAPPPGERADRWRKRSMSWGSDSNSNSASIVYEYGPGGVPPS